MALSSRSIRDRGTILTISSFMGKYHHFFASLKEKKDWGAFQGGGKKPRSFTHAVPT